MKKPLLYALALSLVPCLPASAQEKGLIVDQVSKLGDSYCPHTLSPIPCKLDIINLSLSAAILDVQITTLRIAATTGDKALSEQVAKGVKESIAGLKSGLEDMQKKYPLKK